MNNLELKDIKNLRLVNKSIHNICNEYINKKYEIKAKISPQNYEDVWKSNSYVNLKASILLFSWNYVHNSFVAIPKQFHNITKLLLTIYVGADFETFDVFFQQLPHLNYFGFLFSFIGQTSINPNWWNTDQYVNLRELEIITTEHNYVRDYNFGPLCRFIQNHSNIRSLRTQYSLLRKIVSILLAYNVSFENLYLHYDGYFSTLNDRLSLFQPWYQKNLYKTLYLEVASNAERFDLHSLYERLAPGIKEINYLKLKRAEKFTYITIRETRTMIVKIVYNKSKWFNLRNYN